VVLYWLPQPGGGIKGVVSGCREISLVDTVVADMIVTNAPECHTGTDGWNLGLSQLSRALRIRQDSSCNKKGRGHDGDLAQKQCILLLKMCQYKLSYWADREGLEMSYKPHLAPTPIWPVQ
jgi:hypothetical protein